MSKVSEKRPLTLPDGNLREDLTNEELSSFRPAHEVLAPQVMDGLRRLGRPPGSNKVSTTVRFDRDILEAFRAGGDGWQTRMNAALREWLQERSQAAVSNGMDMP